MNDQDLRTLAELTARTRDVVMQLRVISQMPSTVLEPDAAEKIRATLTQLFEDTGALSTAVQDREARSWIRREHPPRHAAPPRLTRPGLPLSSETRHNITVQRYDARGLPVNRKDEAPVTSGRWRPGAPPLDREGR